MRNNKLSSENKFMKQLLLGELQTEAGNYNEAEKNLNKTKEMNPMPHVLNRCYTNLVL